eukprot:Opistho-2@90070
MSTLKAGTIRGKHKHTSSGSSLAQATGSVSPSPNKRAADAQRDNVSTTSSTPSNSGTAEDEPFEGWLLKWTNYIKGYQKRWCVLKGGCLSYYRSKEEMEHTCRGTINLAGAMIYVEDKLNLTLSTGAQVYNLRANSEKERQTWISRLEAAKAKAAREQADLDGESDSEAEPSEEETDRVVAKGGATASEKIVNLRQTHELVAKQCSALQKRTVKIGDKALEAYPELRELQSDLTMFKSLALALVESCGQFIQEVEVEEKHLRKSVQVERRKRAKLLEAVETLAKEQLVLEKHANKLQVETGGNGSVVPNADDDDGEDEFFDATDDADPAAAGSRPQSSQSRRSTHRGSISVSPPDASTGGRQRRAAINFKPNKKYSLWAVMRNCIGKDLSKIPMPVFFNEPISFLQRLCEDLEYGELLNRAAQAKSSVERMAFVAAFTMSSYANTTTRTGKPFNPILGETYELDLRAEKGFRVITEQVSHHPPICALFAEGKDWTFLEDFSMANKFRGKYLQIEPLGVSRLIFKDTGEQYSWRKVTTTIHNIIVGKLWIDQHGEMDIINHTTGDKCHLKYFEYSYFSRDIARKVSGTVTDNNGMAHYELEGTWDDSMTAIKVSEPTAPATVMWKRSPLPPDHMEMYGFTYFACMLNEMEPNTAPTDSRLRPDQRLMENGLWDEANTEKQRVEEKQRVVRKQREASGEKWEPLWFQLKKDPLTGQDVHFYKGGYWEAKEKHDFKVCPDLW